MSFDVRDYQRGLAALDSMPEEYRRIDILVNNAGRATDLVKFQEGDIRNWDEVIDINIKGFIYMARIVSERMAQQGGGHIVNLGSIAGTEAYEAGNVYCATKHAVHASAAACASTCSARASRSRRYVRAKWRRNSR